MLFLKPHTYLREDVTIDFVVVLHRVTGGRFEARVYGCISSFHALENAFLQATALGLGACTLGSFDPAKIRRAAMLSKDEEPVYLMTIGTQS